MDGLACIAHNYPLLRVQSEWYTTSGRRAVDGSDEHSSSVRILTFSLPAKGGADIPPGVQTLSRLLGFLDLPVLPAAASATTLPYLVDGSARRLCPYCKLAVVAPSSPSQRCQPQVCVTYPRSRGLYANRLSKKRPWMAPRDRCACSLLVFPNLSDASFQLPECPA